MTKTVRYKLHWFGFEKPRILQQSDGIYLYVNEPEEKFDCLGITDGRTVSYEVIVADTPRLPFRYHIYRLNSMIGEREGSLWTFCDHRIDEEGIRAETHLSQHLAYRVVGDESAGNNSDGLFESEAVKQGLGAEMSSMTEEDIADNLFCHFKNKIFPSHWISFTQSPLFLFCTALEMIQKGYTNLRMATIDLSKLPQGSRIYHAGALLEAYRVDAKLPYKNMAGTVLLAWDTIRAPTTLISLDGFFQSPILDQHVRQTFDKLQPLHYDTMPHTIGGKGLHSFLKEARQRLRVPSTIRSMAYKVQLDDQKGHERTIRKAQAPKLWRSKYEAGRLFYGRKVNNRWDVNKRYPIGSDVMQSHISLVERVPVEYRFSMLVALLAAKLYHYERDSVLEAVTAMIPRDDPMIIHHGCIVRDIASPDLPELDAYEDLLWDCTQAFGIEVKLNKDQPLRNVLPIDAPHATMPQLDDLSEEWGQIFLDFERRGIKKRRRSRFRKAAARRTFQAKRRALLQRAGPTNVFGSLCKHYEITKGNILVPNGSRCNPELHEISL